MFLRYLSQTRIVFGVFFLFVMFYCFPKFSCSQHYFRHYIWQAEKRFVGSRGGTSQWLLSDDATLADRRSRAVFEDAETHLLKAKELSKVAVPEIHKELAQLYANDLKKYKEAADELELYLKATKLDKNAAEQMRKVIIYERKQNLSNYFDQTNSNWICILSQFQFKLV